MLAHGAFKDFTEHMITAIFTAASMACFSCHHASCFILQLMFMGAFIGSGLFGWLCDRWGRPIPLFLATALVAASMFASLAAPSYWVMAALRAVTGIGAAGQAHCMVLLCTEPVGPDFRCADWHHNSASQLALHAGQVGVGQLSVACCDSPRCLAGVVLLCCRWHCVIPMH